MYLFHSYCAVSQSFGSPLTQEGRDAQSQNVRNKSREKKRVVGFSEQTFGPKIR